MPSSSFSSSSSWSRAHQLDDEAAFGDGFDDEAGNGSRDRGLVRVSNAVAEEERAWVELMHGDQGGLLDGDYDDDDDDDVYEWEGGGRAGGATFAAQESLTQDWDKPTLDTQCPCK